MITLYTWTTPNGRKASIMLEEVGLPYRVVPVNIGKDEQFAPAFLAISPNNKIPAIVDEGAGDGAAPLAVFESGAILVYLAELTGKLLPAHGAARAKVLEWLFWQVGGLGPMLGQLGYFAMRAPAEMKVATPRFREEAERLLGVMERRLAVAGYLGGDDYSIADIAAYPWVAGAARLLPMDATPSVARWLAEVGARPAVARGMAVPDVS